MHLTLRQGLRCRSMAREEDIRWKVGELARATGLTVRALHHYDNVGLLVPSQRTSGGHRVYDAQDARRLYRILALRRLGFRLDEIASLLDEGGVSLLETVRRHLEQVERELAIACAGSSTRCSARRSRRSMTTSTRWGR